MMLKRKRFGIKIKTESLVVLCLFLLSFTLMFSRFKVSLLRLIYSIKDFGLSVAHWFVFVFDDWFVAINGQAPTVNVTVNTLPSVDVQSILPFDLAVVIYKFNNLWYALSDGENFYNYNMWLLMKLYDITLYTSTFLPLFLVLWIALKEIILSKNDKELGEKSKGVIWLDGIAYRCKPFVVNIVDFIKKIFSNKKVIIPLGVIWAVNLNIFTLGIEFFAFYYYFISSFDVMSVPIQFMKLGVDVLISLFGITIPVCVVLFYIFFDMFRKRRGIKNLEHNEAMNCGFALMLNICTLVVGPMRIGKTSFVTDVILSFVNIFKRKMHDTIYKYDMMFPQFPWELFERDIKERVASHQIFNIPGIDLYIDVLESVFERTPAPCYLYYYDYNTYGIEKDIGHKKITVFDAMRTYAKAYFVYINDNPAMGNYPIRFDGKFSDSEFFPRWDGGFFKQKPGERESRFSHILDQDLFRVGIPEDKNNPLAGTFSYGLYYCMEFGKSQENDKEIQDVDRNSEESNQKNDLYDYSLFCAGHANTMIDNFCVFRFLSDDQRPMAIPKKLRDCFSILTIMEKSELKLAMPCFFVEEWIYNHVYEPFREFYYEYREKRGDRILPVMLVKLFVSALSNYYWKIYNTYGYFEMDVALEAGTAYGEGSPADRGAVIHKWRLAVKKVYGDKYATDGLRSFFSKKQLESGLGMSDYDTYRGLHMDLDEMQKQHERSIIRLMKIMIGGDEPARSVSKKKTVGKAKVKFDWDV